MDGRMNGRMDLMEIPNKHTVSFIEYDKLGDEKLYGLN
jgi:hypothetical protein